MKRHLLLCLLLASFGLAGCSSLPFLGHREDFVRVHGTRFTRGGKPYYYAGANLWYGCYLGSTGPTGDRPRLTRELDSLSASGIVNLRVLGASEESYLKKSVKPAIQQAPGVYDQHLLVGLDFLLDEMRKRDMHAVIFLNNYWEWSGGMTQYNTWANGTPGPDPEDPAQGWAAFMDYSATFLTNDRANAMFRDYVRMLVTRVNTVNGRAYAQDPTIMAWQLANEPRPGRDNDLGVRNLPAYYSWLDATARFIHALDTNHLVSAGSEGLIGTLQVDEYFLKAFAPPSLNYLTLHLWPKNWGWFDPNNITVTLPPSEQKALGYLNKHIALARTLEKPLVMEEFGMARDSGRCRPGAPATARDHYYALLLNAVYDSARTGSPMAGTNFWTWSGDAVSPRTDDTWRPGDPLMGDPPQEPQGYNSIGNADRSTMAIIRDHALKMLRLEPSDSLTAFAGERNP